MDIFEKCNHFYHCADYAQELGYPTNPRMAQALGIYPFFIPIDQSNGTEAFIDNRKIIMIGSNNYLGLANHPRVKQAAIDAISKYGTSCTGSRFLNGTLSLHLELEERLAKFVGKEATLVFTTGYQTNVGTITSIIGKDDVIIFDKDIHASVIDGARLAKTAKPSNLRYFVHNNMDSLEKVLKDYPESRGKLVIVEGVYSMKGDLTPLPEVICLCKQYQAKLMVDDAHAFGVLGNGRGTLSHYNCKDDVDLVMGTFSKAFVSTGGFIAGTKEVIHWIQHFARPFIFSASLSPANISTVLAVLDIIESEPDHIEKVNTTANRIRTELRQLGYNIGNTQTPIIPIIIGDQFKTLQAWDFLLKAGIYTNVALPPAVPPHSSLLRTSYMATHTNEQVDIILAAFSSLRDHIGIV